MEWRVFVCPHIRDETHELFPLEDTRRLSAIAFPLTNVDFAVRISKRDE